MHAVRTALCVIAAVLGAATGAGSQGATPRDALLVSAEWLAQHRADPDLVLFHVGPPASYAEAHIPGARQANYVELAAAGERAGKTLEMLPATVLRGRLAALGVSDRSHVVVYFAKGWISPAARVVFTLDYAGLSKVSLLDGGLEEWTRGGREVTTAASPATPGNLSPLETKPTVVDAAFVKAHLNTAGYSVVDGRTAPFYDGVETGGGPKPHRTGHIAGALSVPFNTLFDAQGALLPAPELSALFARAGAKPGDTIVGYCHIGQQATAMLFAARTLGYRVLLYDGSFEDWTWHADYPVENPSAKKQ